MHTKIIAALAAVAAMSGCATGRAPTAEATAALPVVNYGEAAPGNLEYILHFPAGKPIPTRVFIRGSALVNDVDNRLVVALRRDLYVYKQWASFDGKFWRRDNEVIGVKLEVKVPSPTHPHQGELGMRVDFKDVR